MSRDFLKGVKDEYDVIVIGSGLAGLTGANTLAKMGHSVLLLEHHYQFGGLATWFTRKRGHIFDISLHGFPAGMIKSTRKYWTQEISNSIEQLKHIRFVNPQFDITTTFDRQDFTKILTEQFKLPLTQVEAFFHHLEQMNYYDNDTRTTKELFETFFPGRSDVHRLLLEPIAYANGSTQEDPAIAYGIVFSNFMNKGVFIFKGGADTLIDKMTQELQKNGVELRKRCKVERILVETDPTNDNPENKKVVGVVVNGRTIRAKAVLSNANIKNTLFHLVGKENIEPSFAQQAEAVRVNTSSSQVYIGIREGESIPFIGDLIFTSNAKDFSSEELLSFHTKSRTYSMYYPDTRPHNTTPRYAVVCSINSRWEDWANLSDEDYAFHKERIIEESIVGLEKFIPDIRSKIDWTEAATPKTINRFTTHWMGTSFGTKFEGLGVSMNMSKHIEGLYHAGSVGIIMSGWLGTINYGVITANKIDSYFTASSN
jgi:all-trans-retinol 13,14-reductase